MVWRDAIRAWLDWLAAGGASRATLRLRRYQLVRLADDLRGSPATVPPARLARWLAGMEWSAETRRSHLAGLRSFFGWCVAMDLIAIDPTVGLPRMRPVPGAPRPAPESAITDALRLAHPRVRLMIELAALHGLRRGEISRIHARDLTESPAGTVILVHGKGGKERTIPLRASTAAAIRLAAAGAWLFPNGQGSHLSPGHVGVLIGRTLPAGVTPHMLRHRFATVVYRRTLDIRNLQLLLGHASVATTQRYAAPDPDLLRQVLEAAG